MAVQRPFEVNVSSKFGAPMGRYSDPNLSGKVYLQKVPFYDNCYDKGGAYWGMGDQLWCAWNDEGAYYVRAHTRLAARLKLTGNGPDQAGLDITFYRL